MTIIEVASPQTSVTVIGESESVTIHDTQVQVVESIPVLPGPQGIAATIGIGTITTGTAGSSASVSNSGTSTAAVFNFTIPRGDQGVQGIQGIQGPAGEDAAVPPAGPAFTYDAGALTRIDYDDGSFKVFTYSGGKLSQIDFTRDAVTTRRTFNYTGDVLTSIDDSTL